MREERKKPEKGSRQKAPFKPARPAVLCVQGRSSHPKLSPVYGTQPCSGLSAENADFPAPRSRSGDTPLPTVTALALAVAVPPRFF